MGRVNLFLIIASAARAGRDLIFPGINIGIGTDRAEPDKAGIQGKLLILLLPAENPEYQDNPQDQKNI